MRVKYLHTHQNNNQKSLMYVCLTLVQGWTKPFAALREGGGAPRGSNIVSDTKNWMSNGLFSKNSD